MKKMFALLLLLVFLAACEPVDVQKETDESVNSAEIIGNQVIIFIDGYGVGYNDTLRMMVRSVEIWKQDNPCYEVSDINYLTVSHASDIPTSVVFTITPKDC